jgi:hypothetical protein
LEVVLPDSAINDGGGSLTVDNSNLDTQLTVLLAQLKLVDTSKLDTNLTALLTQLKLIDTSNLDTSLNTALGNINTVLNQILAASGKTDSPLAVTDNGGSITTDNTYLDTNLTALLAQLKLIDTSKLDTPLSTAFSSVISLLTSINGKTGYTIDNFPSTTPAMSDITLNVPTVYEITLTDTSTVDSTILLPAKCVGFEMWTAVTTHTLRWMINSGTYAIKNPGVPYNTFSFGGNYLFQGRLYLKDTTEAGCVVTVIVWTKP